MTLGDLILTLREADVGENGLKIAYFCLKRPIFGLEGPVFGLEGPIFVNHSRFAIRIVSFLV